MSSSRHPIACIYTQSSQKLQGLAEACFQFTPRVALLPQAVGLDLTGTQGLYSKNDFVKSIYALLALFDLKGSVHFGASLPEALARAVYRTLDIGAFPLEALTLYAQGLCDPELLDFPLKRLSDLGLCHLKDLHSLCPQELGTRFGKDFMRVLEATRIPQLCPWPQLRLPEIFVEHDEPDESLRLSELEPLCFQLKALCDRLFARLNPHHKRPTALSLTLTQAPRSTLSQPVRSFTFTLAFPVLQVPDLLKLLRERLSRELSAQPLEAPLVRISLSIDETCPYHAPQLSYLSKAEVEATSLSQLINHLQHQLGSHAVFLAEPVASYVPERSFKKTLQLHPNALSLEAQHTCPSRPLRLLKRPLALTRHQSLITCGQRRWHISELQGPERIAGEWWHADTPRDYFYVKTREGEDLWIFQNPGQDAYFLHGLFD